MITIVLPFCAADADQCINQLKWINDLGGCLKNPAVLITDPASLAQDDGWPDAEKLKTIQKLARKNFKSVQQIFTPYRRRRADGTSTWPLGANWAFYSVAFFMAMTSKTPWLFLEPDAVPLKEGWIETLEKEYSRAGKKMMGSVLDTNLPKENPQYMNGVAIYDARALLYFDRAMIDFLNGVDAAFDLAAAPQVMPQAHPTRLIQHFWGDFSKNPIFKETKEDGDEWNVMTLESLYPEAVLFHRVKANSTLIDLLRARRNESKVKLA